MPEETPRLGIKKFLGNELIKREKFNENYDIIDEKVALREELDAIISSLQNEDISGYSFEGQGVCKSGELVELSQEDYKIALIPLIDKYPQDYPYFEAPQNVTVSGGVQDTYKNTYVAVQGVDNNGKKGAYTIVIREGYYPRSDNPIEVTWSGISGVASYNVYVSSGTQWKLYTNTTNTSCNITGYTGSPQNPTYDIAEQFLRIEYTKNENGFIPYMENYISTSQATLPINVNKGVGETYQFQTPQETNSVFINMHMTWTLNWSGFSGSCTWGVRFRIRWKKYGEENWLGNRTFEHTETWGNQWIGGSKSYYEQTNINLYNLEQGVYVFEVYDIYEWKNNGNFWFNPHLRVYINNMIYQISEKINEYHGIYLLFVKK